MTAPRGYDLTLNGPTRLAIIPLKVRCPYALIQSPVQAVSRKRSVSRVVALVPGMYNLESLPIPFLKTFSDRRNRFQNEVDSSGFLISSGIVNAESSFVGPGS